MGSTNDARGSRGRGGKWVGTIRGHIAIDLLGAVMRTMRILHPPTGEHEAPRRSPRSGMTPPTEARARDRGSAVALAFPQIQKPPAVVAPERVAAG